MTYGLEIKNDSNRLIIDSTYPNLYLESDTASLAAVGSAYPILSSGNDMIVARPYLNQNGIVIPMYSDPNNPNTNNPTTTKYFWGHNPLQGYTPSPPMPSTGYNYHIIKNYRTATTPTGGYGLAISDPSSTSLLYSCTLSEKNPQLSATGLITGATSNPNNYGAGITTWSQLITALEAYGEPNMISYYPSKTGVITDLDKYYCCMSNSFGQNETITFLVDAGPDWSYTAAVQIENITGFEYIWTGNNEGRIRIVNILKINGEIQGSSSGSVYNPLNYFIFKVLG